MTKNQLAAARRATIIRSDAAKMAHMVRRIRGAFESCSVQDLADGVGWYDRAAAAAQDMAGADMLRAAGVLAALSPRCAWKTNLSWARAVLVAVDTGAECPVVHTTTMRGQAWRIAQGAPALSVLNGPKVRSFFANISGDVDTVTVDVWAARVAEGWTAPQPHATSRVTQNRRKKGTGAIALGGQYKTEPAPAGKRYVMIASAYRTAAAKENADRAKSGSPLGPISARDLQAAVWTAIRGSAL